MSSASKDAHKHLRVGHRSERGAVNAVRTLLEAHGLVVDETAGRADYGRDLTVDLTRADKITGGVIGVQVKGDKRFIRDGDWELPATAKDLLYWAESTIPIVGVLWDSVTGGLRWTNLTSYARADDRAAKVPTTPGRAGPRNVVRLPSEQRLDNGSVDAFVNSMTTYLNQSGAGSLLALFDTDEQRQRSAIADCWALGRNDGRSFRLLRRTLPDLHGTPLVDAIIVLSHLTNHPDILWTDLNWVQESVRHEVRSSFRWSPEELVHLVGEVERYGDYPSWERGGVGQCLFHLLIPDDQLEPNALVAVDLAVRRQDLDTAVRLLILHQWLADDPRTAVHECIGKHRELAGHRMARVVVEMVDEFGHVDVY